VERTSYTGDPNNGGYDNDLTPPLGRGTTPGGGDDDGYDSSSSSQKISTVEIRNGETHSISILGSM